MQLLMRELFWNLRLVLDFSYQSLRSGETLILGEIYKKESWLLFKTEEIYDQDNF